MGIDTEALAKLQADFQRVTGKPCPDFNCPILNAFGVGSRGLMDGHILPQSIQTASRATVIQRADVDNDFGKVEAVLCDYLNRPFYEVRELYKRARNLTITGSSGIPSKAFFASKNAKPPYPQVPLADKHGEIIASPFVKTSMDKQHEYDGPVDVEGELVFSIPALAVSLIKSAHLALFKLLGYEWVFCQSGQYIGMLLATVVGRDADAVEVKQVASELPNCFMLLKETTLPDDTLSTQGIIFHYDYYDGPGHPAEHGKDAWAVSCWFNTNGHLWTVMLPFSIRPDGFDDAIKKYKRYMSEPAERHTAYRGQVRSDGNIEHCREGQNVFFPDTMEV
jgi:hypothetical protein